MNYYMKALAKMYDGPSKYAWILDKDNICDGPKDSDVGTMGPSDMPEGLEEHLKAKKTHGVKFRMLDDDGEIYYYGRYVGPDDDNMFGPLRDFGEPNAGCTDIQYATDRKPNGDWDYQSI